MILEKALWRTLEVPAGGIVDGDTVRARDISPESAGALMARLRLTPAGELVLRLVGVDTPESWYPAAHPLLASQPVTATAAALATLNRVLAGSGAQTGQAGSTGSTRCTGQSEHAGRAGNARPAEPGRQILRAQLRAVDRYGRGLALVWPADRAPAAGQALTAAGLLGSINAVLLAEGCGYPDFHDDLPPAWIDALAEQVAQARLAARGVWSQDHSASGFALSDWTGLREARLILPRLFRRVGDFWRQEAPGRTPVAPGSPAEQHRRGLRFREFLEQRERPLRRRAGGAAIPFAELLDIDGENCQLRDHVEKFLYQSASPRVKLT